MLCAEDLLIDEVLQDDGHTPFRAQALDGLSGFGEGVGGSQDVWQVILLEVPLLESLRGLCGQPHEDDPPPGRPIGTVSVRHSCKIIQSAHVRLSTGSDRSVDPGRAR